MGETVGLVFVCLFGIVIYHFFLEFLLCPVVEQLQLSMVLMFAFNRQDRQ